LFQSIRIKYLTSAAIFFVACLTFFEIFQLLGTVFHFKWFNEAPFLITIICTGLILVLLHIPIIGFGSQSPYFGLLSSLYHTKLVEGLPILISNTVVTIFNLKCYCL
jgi:hypothetical protein